MPISLELIGQFQTTFSLLTIELPIESTSKSYLDVDAMILLIIKSYTKKKALS